MEGRKERMERVVVVDENRMENRDVERRKERMEGVVVVVIGDRRGNKEGGGKKGEDEEVV